MENNIENEKNEALDFMSNLIDLGVGFFSSWQKDIDKNKALLKTNYDHIGKIVTCHLVIESLINKEIMNHLGHDENTLEGIRLSFMQKLKLLPAKNKAFEYVIPAIKEVNSLRNSLSHCLAFDMKKAKTPKIDALVDTMTQKDNMLLPLEERIETFTIGCISLFSMHSRDVNDHMGRFQEKHPEAYKNIIDIFNPQTVSTFLNNRMPDANNE